MPQTGQKNPGQERTVSASPTIHEEHTMTAEEIENSDVHVVTEGLRSPSAVPPSAPVHRDAPLASGGAHSVSSPRGWPDPHRDTTEVLQPQGKPQALHSGLHGAASAPGREQEVQLIPSCQPGSSLQTARPGPFPS